MTAVFGEKEKKDAFRTKKRLLIGWLISLGVFFAVVGTLIAINAVDVAVTRSRRFYIPFTVLTIVLSSLYFGGTLFFFSIKYRLTRRYCIMFREMNSGLKDRTHGKFVAIDPQVVEKDGVFFYSLVLDCPPLRRGDITERKVLVERTHSLPDFAVGEDIGIISHANILMAYERGASPAAVATEETTEAAREQTAEETVTQENTTEDEEL